MTENLIAQIRAYSHQLAEEMIPVESEEGVPVVVAQKVFDAHLPPTRPRWVFGLAVAITILLLGLVVSLLPSVDITTSSRAASNGWVAFTVHQDSLMVGDRDIFLVGEGQPARRIIGSDSDRLDQTCPAFSPDGARLAYGQAEGTLTDGYSGGALVISDVDEMGNASVVLEFDAGAASAPPCPTWSPDGKRIAMGVHEGRPLRQGYSWFGTADVWIVDLDSGQTTVLPDLYVATETVPMFTDMEWSPDGTKLAIANGQILLYSTLTDEVETLESSTGIHFLTWSPDGTAIAYQQVLNPLQELVILITALDGGANKVVADRITPRGFSSGHGIGPVWSPTGDQIAYQRKPNPCPFSICPEMDEVVLVDPQGIETVFSIESFPFPYRVTWSPDGHELLYSAWGCKRKFPDAATDGCLIAVPIDSSSPPIMLSADLMISELHEGSQLTSQSWGRRPASP